MFDLTVYVCTLLIAKHFYFHAVMVFLCTLLFHCLYGGHCNTYFSANYSIDNQAHFFSPCTSFFSLILDIDAFFCIYNPYIYYIVLLAWSVFHVENYSSNPVLLRFFFTFLYQRERIFCFKKYYYHSSNS